MKKNLFGAVSAALALALAITSFGCESGNDSPLRNPTDADRAALDKATFKYVANPTNILVTEADLTDKSAALFGASTEITGYTLQPSMEKLYIDGVQSYNKKSGKIKTEKKAEVGNVYNTFSETIALKYDGTFEYTDSTSNYEVKEIVFETDAQWGAAGRGQAAYERIEDTGDNYEIADAVVAAKGAYDTKKTAFEAAETAWKNAGSLPTGSEKTAYDAAKAAFEAAESAYYLAWAFREGARYTILDKTTVAGKTTGSLKYVEKLDGGKVYYTKDLSGGETKAKASGKYTIDGTYKQASILITTWEKLDFDDAAGTYVDRSTSLNNPNKGDIERDYPEKSYTPAVVGKNNIASKFCKKGRSLSLNNGVITTNKIETSLDTVAADSKTYEQLFGFSNVTYSAYPDAYKTSYNYKLQ